MRAIKRLKLGRIAETPSDRLVLADKQDMALDDLLLMVLTDEMARRDSAAAQTRARRRTRSDDATRAVGQEYQGSFDKRMLAELTSVRFLEAHRHVVVLAPVGVGKTFIPGPRARRRR